MATGGVLLLGSGCDRAALQAVAVGLEAATDHFLQEDDDITFGDWLMSELEDLND